MTGLSRHNTVVVTYHLDGLTEICRELYVLAA